MNRRHLTVLALLLTGCASYTWTDGGQMTDWLRWEVVPREGFQARCGFLAPTHAQAGAACAVRLQNGIVMPGDRNIHTGEVATERSIGRLCVVIATMTEDEARRMLADDRSLWEHEMAHCVGLNHEWRK